MVYNNLAICHCPHCGGEGKIKGRKKQRVVCTKCGAQGAEKPLASQAVASWNQESMVRCKDCIYYDGAFFLCLNQNLGRMACYDYDYCSRAVRKDE